MPETGAARSTRASGRPRQQRAVNREGNEAAIGALGKVRDALPEITGMLIEDAKKGNVDARRLVVSMATEELRRARASGAMEILDKLEEVRAAGSPMLAATWKQLYEKNPAFAGTF